MSALECLFCYLKTVTRTPSPSWDTTLARPTMETRRSITSFTWSLNEWRSPSSSRSGSLCPLLLRLVSNYVLTVTRASVSSRPYHEILQCHHPYFSIFWSYRRLNSNAVLYSDDLYFLISLSTCHCETFSSEKQRATK